MTLRERLSSYKRENKEAFQIAQRALARYVKEEAHRRFKEVPQRRLEKAATKRLPKGLIKILAEESKKQRKANMKRLRG